MHEFKIDKNFKNKNVYFFIIITWHKEGWISQAHFWRKLLCNHSFDDWKKIEVNNKNETIDSIHLEIAENLILDGNIKLSWGPIEKVIKV